MNYIVQNSLWAFFDKIKYSYKEEYKQFDGGYIVRSCFDARIENYLKDQQNKKPPKLEKPKNEMNTKTLAERRTISLTSEHLLSALYLSLYQIKPIILEMNNNQNMDIKNFAKKINYLISKNSTKLNSYESLLSEIIGKIEISLGIEEQKEFYDQAEQFDEAKKMAKFMKKHKNAKMIQKLSGEIYDDYVKKSIKRAELYNIRDTAQKYNEVYLNMLPKRNINKK